MYFLTLAGSVSASQTLALGASIVTVLTASKPRDTCFLHGALIPGWRATPFIRFVDSIRVWAGSGAGRDDENPPARPRSRSAGVPFWRRAAPGGARPRRSAAVAAKPDGPYGSYSSAEV